MHSAARVYSRAEKLADGIVHAIAIGLSLTALITLIVLAVEAWQGVQSLSLLIYGATVLLVFCASAAYNLSGEHAGREFLQRIDRAAIYLKIAGTCTPLALAKLGGVMAATVLGGVWAIAVIAVPLQLFIPTALAKVAVALYLTQGWLVMLAIVPLSQALSSQGLALVIIGGVLYTVGVAFFLWSRLRFHNVIWHGLVLLASICMFAAVYKDVVLAAI
ncbi:MAG: hemolysin III family protein [Neomegalonema sp.]|nr:hemolysin III family protein [Neomegalonema sp.]